MTTEEEIEFIRSWAGKNKLYLDTEGTCGFGRECVGVVYGDHYPEYDGGDERVTPDYEDTPNYYHKTDCVAVLGRGPEAIHELYLWIKKLVDNGATVEIRDRKPDNVIDALFHGYQEPWVIVP